MATEPVDRGKQSSESGEERAEPLEPTNVEIGMEAATAFGAAATAALSGDVFGAALLLLGKGAEGLINDRTSRFVSALREDLDRLSEQVDGLTEERLAKSEVFVSMLIETVDYAARTNVEEKLNALRNAILNVAAGPLTEDDQQTMFLAMINDFTPTHLRMLRFLQDPLGEIRKSGFEVGIESNTPQLGTLNVFPDLNENAMFYAQCVRELFARGLLKDNKGWANMMQDKIGWGKQTDAFGDLFLEFISSPIERQLDKEEEGEQ